MLQFILGLIVGGIVGFGVCAIISINNSDKDNRPYGPDGNITGENKCPK